MIVFSPYSSPRLSYVLDFIFGECFASSYQLIFEKNDIPTNQKVLEYNTQQSIEGSFFIKASSLLFEEHLEECKESSQWFNDPLNENNDYLSMIFFCLSRHEEYQNKPRDSYNRFPSTSSILSKNKLLRTPVVDLMVDHLGKQMNHFFDTKLELSNETGVQISFDIDQVWLAKHIPTKIKLGRLLKQLMSLDFKGIKEHKNIRQGKIEDPFDILNILNKYHIYKPLFFFLFAERSPYDKGHNPSLNVFKKLISRLAKDHKVGIHPSMASSKNPALLADEMQKFHSIPNVTKNISRQHYLAFSLPDTYRHLYNLGIREEYSMGYADAIGYRSGTARSFYWFDLQKNEVTDLRIFPFQIMDVSLKNYLKLSPASALTKAEQMVKQAAIYKSPLRILWHNSSFYPKHGWGGWEKIFEYLVKHQRTKDFD